MALQKDTMFLVLEFRNYDFHLFCSKVYISALLILTECRLCVGHGDDWKKENGHCGKGDSDDHQNKENGAFDFSKSKDEETNVFGKQMNGEGVDEMGTVFSYSYPEETNGEDWIYSLDITDESPLDGEVGRRLNNMVPVPVSITVVGITIHSFLTGNICLYGFII